MKKKKLFIILGGVLAVVVFAVLSMTSSSGKTVKVNSATVERLELVEKVSASGRIQPRSKVDITAEINAEIIALPVREGQAVEMGDLLVVLDTVQYSSDVRQARFRLDEINARLEGARTSLEQNQEEHERQQQLFDQNLTSETAYKVARYAHLNSQATYKAMQAQARQLQAAFEKQLDYLGKATIVAPMAGVITFLDVEVGEIAAAQTAFTQGKTLMTISDLSVFEVEVEVDETEINKIALGQKTDIEVDAIPDTTFAGEVVEIGNTAIMAGYGTQDQTTNFKVKVTFADVDIQLRPGMSATVDITSAERKDVLVVPFSAVVMRTYDVDSLEAARAEDAAGTTSVAEVQAAENEDEEEQGSVEEEESESEEQGLVDEKESDSEQKDSVKEKKSEPEELKGIFVIRDGVARFMPVETGIADQKNIEVTVGLEETDSVVSGPYRVLRTIRDGDAVEIISKSEEGN